MPAPKVTPSGETAVEPAVVDPPGEPEARDVLKDIVREVLDEWSAERTTDPKRTQPRNFLLELLGGSA